MAFDCQPGGRPGITEGNGMDAYDKIRSEAALDRLDTIAQQAGRVKRDLIRRGVNPFKAVAEAHKAYDRAYDALVRSERRPARSGYSTEEVF